MIGVYPAIGRDHLGLKISNLSVVALAEEDGQFPTTNSQVMLSPGFLVVGVKGHLKIG